MLKSLGQWTTPSKKSRNPYPSGSAVASVRMASGDAGDGDNNILTVANETNDDEPVAR